MRWVKHTLFRLTLSLFGMCRLSFQSSFFFLTPPFDSAKIGSIFIWFCNFFFRRLTYSLKHINLHLLCIAANAVVPKPCSKYHIFLSVCPQFFQILVFSVSCLSHQGVSIYPYARMKGLFLKWVAQLT